MQQYNSLFNVKSVYTFRILINNDEYLMYSFLLCNNGIELYLAALLIVYVVIV